MPGRIEIDDVRPVVSCGRYPAKAVVGETVPVSATVWREGHEAVAATLVVRCLGRSYPRLAKTADRRTAVPGPAAPGLQRVKPMLIPMSLGTQPDAFHAQFTPDGVGLWTFRVDGWGDPISTWRRAVTAKLDAGQSEPELSNDLLVGARLFERAAMGMPRKLRDPLLEAAAGLRAPGDPLTRMGAACTDEVAELLAQYPLRELLTRGEQYGVWVDRPLARFGSWYEMFPRSTGGWGADGKPVHGTFATATEALPRIAAIGFDVVYLPPIHPIGKVHRKGRNNSVTAAPGDVGSPWAIGSDEGGHDAVHPDLGTIDDFEAFVTAARGQGLEVALDLALQCAPDHPWAREHPEWFTVLPDGTIAYAENPPKKYQDIYPLNFDNDPDGLYAEVLRVVRHWIDHGVKVFRVDNPHTKPPNFWEWLIEEVKSHRSGRAVPVGGVHPPGPLVRPGQAGIHAVLHVFHLAHREVGADGIRPADRRIRRLRTAEPLRQYARHPARESAARRSGHVRDSRGARRDDEPHLGRVLRLRAVRAPTGARGQRGVPGFREVPTAAARLRRCAGARGVSGAVHQPTQRDSTASSGTASASHHPLPPTSTTTRCWPTASSTRRPATPCSWSSR